MSDLSRALLGVALATALFCVVPAGVRADVAANGSVTVTVATGQSLRDLAKVHLGDPNLWPDILRASGMKTVAEVRPGEILKIPVAEITAARDALATSLEKIQRANRAGAQVFAADEIKQAIGLHDEAVVKRKAGAWTDTVQLASRAGESALAAYNIAFAKRDQAGQARLSDREGAVEGRKPADDIWSDRRLNALLIEEEKVRTLSGATAQITFRDASRLRLSPNSHAIIERLRTDPLNRREEAKVSLVEGDFYALLASKNKRKKFSVEIPDVKTRIDSGSFWVRNDSKSAKFTNYDNRKVEISAGGSSVTLGKNEGAIIRRDAVTKGEAGRTVTPVLPAPGGLKPADTDVQFGSGLKLGWAPVDKASGYWVEVAHDPGFQRMVVSKWGLETPQFEHPNLEPGTYYWRVAAYDPLGLPGPKSETTEIRLQVDVAPPYLRIEQPAINEIMREAGVRVRGETEPGATLTVNGKPVKLGGDGRFETLFEAVPGSNILDIRSVDPAGNVNQIKRTFSYMPDREVEIAFDAAIPRREAGFFLTGGREISLTGRTAANARIEILDGDGKAQASAESDGEGRFTINLPVADPDLKYTFRVTLVTGFSTTETIRVGVDTEPPTITLEEILPRLVSESFLRVKGRVENGLGLQLNGRQVALKDGLFDEELILKPGGNTIEMVSADEVGNVRIAKYEVTFDDQPPEFLGHSVKPANGGRLAVEVTAKDGSGLARTAPFTVRAGDRSFTGYLRYNRATKSYRGTVRVPENLIASAKLREVELLDDAGNRRQVRIK